VWPHIWHISSRTGNVAAAWISGLMILTTLEQTFGYEYHKQTLSRQLYCSDWSAPLVSTERSALRPSLLSERFLNFLTNSWIMQMDLWINFRRYIGTMSQCSFHQRLRLFDYNTVDQCFTAVCIPKRPYHSLLSVFASWVMIQVVGVVYNYYSWDSKHNYWIPYQIPFWMYK
jgi:hypothetical protein